MKLLASLVRSKLPNSKAGKYVLLETELPPIARESFVLDHFSENNLANAGKSAATVAQHHVANMAGGDSSALAPAFLSWLWNRSRGETEKLLETVGYDWAAALRNNERRLQERTSGAVVVGSQSSSLFNLEHVLTTVQQEVILVAQNHWHMISKMRGNDHYYRGLIGQALARGANVNIVAMSSTALPRKGEPPAEGYPDALSLWRHYQDAVEFRTHLELCWTTLRGWHDLGIDNWSHLLGKLLIYEAYFLPLTISVIDPGTPSGFVIVSPRTMEKVSGERPQFVLRKASDRQSFDYYANSVENGFPNFNWTLAFG